MTTVDAVHLSANKLDQRLISEDEVALRAAAFKTKQNKQLTEAVAVQCERQPQQLPPGLK